MSFRRTLYVVLVLIVAAGVGTVIYLQRSLPEIARDIVQHQIPGSDFAELDVGFTEVTVRDLSFADADRETRVMISRVQADFDPLSLFGGELRVRTVRVTEPHFDIRREAADAADAALAEDLEEMEAAAVNGEAVARPLADRPAAAARGEARSLRIDRVEVRDGSARIVDARRATGARPEIVLTNLRLDASDLSHPLRPGRVPVDLRATLESDTPGDLHIRGWIDRVDDAGDITLTAASLPLQLLAAYQDSTDPRENAVAGQIGLDARVRLEQREFRIEGSASLADLVLRRPDARLFGMPATLVREYLEEHDGAVEVDFNVSGNLDQHNPRERLAQAIVTALALKVGSEQVAPLLDRLRDGDVEGAESELRDLRDALRERLRQAE